MDSPAPRSPRDHLRDRLTTVRRAVLRRRRLLAVLCVAGAVAAGLRATAPPAAPTVELVVAARDLPAGQVLGTGDLAVADVPPDALPGGAVTEENGVAGAVLASPLRAGEPVTDVRVVGPGLADAADGRVAVPVRLSDAAQAALLTAGDVIDLMATDPEHSTTSTIAAGAIVLAVPPPADGADALSGRLVVLGISETAVAEVTAAAVTAFVTFAWPNR
ncbi:SAF domain-containing protein [Nocardioides sp. MH1]|uniref:SAF domain-containing protein n=1 Tax=Nocardioides sp. MH1 TaxID=3242490 RepID=UPI0035228AB8